MTRVLRVGSQRTLAIVVGAMIAVIGARPALADTPLERARAAIDASDYLAGRTALTAALASGDLGPTDLVETYRLSGFIAAALGEQAAAVQAFERMLSLAPTTKLAAGTAPKITKRFDAAQALVKGREPVKITVETAATPPSITVVIASDPVHMITSVRAIVRVDGRAEQTFDQPLTDRVTIALPVGRRLDLRVVARDEHGNRVSEVGSTDVPLVIVGPGAPEPTKPVVVTTMPKPNPSPAVHHEQGSQRPVYLAWWLWAGTSVVIAGAGAYFGVGAIGAQHDLEAASGSTHGYAEAHAIETRGKRDALLADIGFAAGGAFAIGAVILYLTAHHGTEADRSPALTAAPVRGGGTLALEVTF